MSWISDKVQQYVIDPNKLLLSKGVSATGTALNLPEYGYSEAIDPRNQSVQTVTSNNVGQATNKTGANQTNNTDQTQLNTNTYGTGGGSSINWADITAAQDLVNQGNDLLSRLGNQRQIFTDNLNSTYQNYRDRLAQDYNRNQGSYNTQKTQTLQDQERANQQIRVQAGQKSNALQRFLGAHGAGDSMAARQLAPYGVARQGQALMNDANNVYGQNLSGLDTSWQQYGTDYQNNINDLASQQENERKKQEQAFLQQEYAARDNISKGNQAINYSKTGDAAAAKALREQALPQLYQILQQIDALGKQSVAPTIKDASYVAPDLQQYNVDQNLQNIQGVDQTAQSDVNPYLQWLLKQKENDFQTFGY